MEAIENGSALADRLGDIQAELKDILRLGALVTAAEDGSGRRGFYQLESGLAYALLPERRRGDRRPNAGRQAGQLALADEDGLLVPDRRQLDERRGSPLASYPGFPPIL
jgi:hypothetical protein